MTSDGEGGHDSVAPVMVHIINVSVMDTPGRDKEKTIYSAETENMDKVSSLNLYFFGSGLWTDDEGFFLFRACATTQEAS